MIEMGTERSKRKYKRLTDEEIDKAKSMLKEGVSVKVVAENIGSSLASIYKIEKNGGKSNGDEHVIKSSPDETICKKKAIGKKIGKYVEKQNGATKTETLVYKLKSQYDKFIYKLEYHRGKAQEYEGEIERL